MESEKIEYTIEDIIAAAQYGFTYSKESQDHTGDVPVGNVLQWMMARKNLMELPEEFKKFKIKRDLIARLRKHDYENPEDFLIGLGINITKATGEYRPGIPEEPNVHVRNYTDPRTLYSFKLVENYYSFQEFLDTNNIKYTKTVSDPC